MAKNNSNKSTESPPERPNSPEDPVIPPILPILPNDQYVLYPSMIAPVVIQGEANVKMIDEAVKGDRLIGVFAVRAPHEEDNGNDFYSFDDVYTVGTVATILKMLKIPDGSVRILVHGVRRVRIVDRTETKPFLRATVEPFRSISLDDTETRAMVKNALTLLKRFTELTNASEDLYIAASNAGEPGKLSDLIASNLSLSIQEQQEILEIEDPKARLFHIQEILTREIEIASLGAKIQTQIKDKLEKTQRDYLLREQIKAFRRELGEEEEEGAEIDQLRDEARKARLPPHVKKVMDKELGRLEAIPPASPEYAVIRTYVDWMLALPWHKKTRDNINLKKAQKILDEDHYDLEKIKERILEYLAVIKLRKTIRGPILCMIGPPGVGKTSLGKSIARAMGRKFARISLGGMRDEAEIRGHRRTYIGSMPGRVISAMKEAETINPVIMLDEIDKLGADFRGDPASALLEVLDPEQNSTFTDHYLDVAYDLSHVMFITTGNVEDTIPDPLLDRMEVLELSGYTLQEKIKIAEQFLIPKAIMNAGLPPNSIHFTQDGIRMIIEHYTLEAGLRNLEREINNVCRKVARRIAEGNKAPFKADAERIQKTLGLWKFTHDETTARANVPGVAVGLAWTPAGGDVLFIESSATPGRGDLVLTGHLGDVMKESAQAALTYLHAHCDELGISQRVFRRKNIHIHVPEGATPKDGPSAGVAVVVSLASLFLNQPVRKQMAMTGEITLKGAVLPVGGIKEKILGAHRSGIRAVILPKLNERHLVDVPKEVKEQMNFHFVERAGEALKLAFPLIKKADLRKPEIDGSRLNRARVRPATRLRKTSRPG